MTPRRLIAADVREIKAIEIQCTRCKGMVTVPIPLPSHLLEEKMPTQLACPSCGAQLWDGDAGYNKMVALLSALTVWQQGASPKFSLGFSLPCDPHTDGG